jgi:excisionase family DNA binding protein
MMEGKQLEANSLMTIEEASRYLQLSVKCLYRYSSERKIPVIKISGRAIRFRREDLDAWIEKHTARPVA